MAPGSQSRGDTSPEESFWTQGFVWRIMWAIVPLMSAGKTTLSRRAFIGAGTLGVSLAASAGPGCVTPAGNYIEKHEQARLHPPIMEKGDACVTASINLAELRWKRRHPRTMHQRRPELYGLLSRDVKMRQDYPEIPWDFPECATLVNKANSRDVPDKGWRVDAGFRGNQHGLS